MREIEERKLFGGCLVRREEEKEIVEFECFLSGPSKLFLPKLGKKLKRKPVAFVQNQNAPKFIAYNSKQLSSFALFFLWFYIYIYILSLFLTHTFQLVATVVFF